MENDIDNPIGYFSQRRKEMIAKNISAKEAQANIMRGPEKRKLNKLNLLVVEREPKRLKEESVGR